jgi:AraC-like DNA-binding protein
MPSGEFNNLKQFSVLSGCGVQVIELDGTPIFETEQYENCLPTLDYINNLMEETLYPQNKAALISGALQSYRFGGRFFFYSPIGLFHFASPIIRDKRHVLTAIGGPILMVPLNDYVALDLEGKLRAGFDRPLLLEQLNVIPLVSPEMANTFSDQLLINAEHLSDSEYLRPVDGNGEQRYSEYILSYFSGTPSYESILRLAEEQKREKSTRKHNKIVREAERYVAKNYARKISLEEVAAHVYVSPSYLSRLFKARTGNTFRRIVNMSRIAEAVRLLEHTEQSLSEVALAIGFEDHSYFTKVFKRHVGMNPSDYRSNLRKI